MGRIASLMKLIASFAIACSLGLGASARAADHLVFEGKSGPGKGLHVVLLAGDEEYRSEEALPMLAKILSERLVEIETSALESVSVGAPQVARQLLEGERYRQDKAALRLATIEFTESTVTTMRADFPASSFFGMRFG